MRRWWLWVGVFATALLVAAFGYGCGVSSVGTCADNGTCAGDSGMTEADGTTDVGREPDAMANGDEATLPVADAGEGGSVPSEAGDGGPPGDGGCDPTKDPKDEPCVVSESYGVFVSATAAPNGAGTKASPLNSIDAGITLAVSQAIAGVPKRVYVCVHSYDETIAIAATRDKIQVFGGFRCTDWTYSGDMAVIAPSSSGLPLTLTSLTSALFADVEIDAPSASQTAPATGSTEGASSIAVLANGSTGIEFRRAKIVAGAAQPGAAGVLAAYTFPTAADLRGNAADGGAGGAAKVHTCTGGLVTIGGKGGNSPGGTGDPGLPALDGGAGGTSAQCIGPTNGGGSGASALSAPNGPGASAAGTIANAVWRPSAGTVGVTGGPGQGGGGGGAVDPGGGGSGGAGGCGGAGGGGGGGGGASICVVCINTALTFTNVTLVSGTAGNGGAGAAGQPGESQGGNPGVPDSSGGCLGGRGGTGGAGGAGGGGAGGVSAGIVYKGTAPALDAMTVSKFVQGQAGPKGVGGVPGTNDGVDGPTGVQILAP